MAPRSLLEPFSKGSKQSPALWSQHYLAFGFGQRPLFTLPAPMDLTPSSKHLFVLSTKLPRPLGGDHLQGCCGREALPPPSPPPSAGVPGGPGTVWALWLCLTN